MGGLAETVVVVVVDVTTGAVSGLGGAGWGTSAVGVVVKVGAGDTTAPGLETTVGAVVGVVVGAIDEGGGSVVLWLVGAGADVGVGDETAVAAGVLAVDWAVGPGSPAAAGELAANAGPGSPTTTSASVAMTVAAATPIFRRIPRRRAAITTRPFRTG